MPSMFTIGLTAVAFFAICSFSHTCESFGLDFVDGGSYFQNSLSNEPFTALQDFQGCAHDSCDNVLVAPNGDQFECSNTALYPDNTPQLVSCAQVPKSSLISGNWSLLLLSNNGNSTPLAYQRMFQLSVGTQQTIFSTETVTVTYSSNPVINVTTTVTETGDVYVPSTTITGSATKTITPKPSTATVTKAYVTLTDLEESMDISWTVETVPASCVSNTQSHVKDQPLSIYPTVLPESMQEVAEQMIEDAVEAGLQGCGFFCMLGYWAKSAKDKQDHSEKGLGHLSRGPKYLEKRAPDPLTTTVTATDTFPTQTNLQTGPLKTQTLTQTVKVKSTITSGTTTVGGQQITVPAQTITQTVRSIYTVITVTMSKHYTITNTVTTTSRGARKSCAQAGGTLA